MGLLIYLFNFLVWCGTVDINEKGDAFVLVVVEPAYIIVGLVMAID